MNTQREPIMVFGADRKATFEAAIEYLSNADPNEAKEALSRCSLRRFQDDPEALAAKLRNAPSKPDGAARFGAWKSAQQVLEVAGIPDPTHYAGR